MQLGIIAIDVDNCGFRHLGKPSPVKTGVSKDGGSPAKGNEDTTTCLSKKTSPMKSLSLSPHSSNDSSLPGLRRYLDGCGLAGEIEVVYVSSELELIEKLIKLVRRVDPDFLIGYEVTMASWGYLIERAATLNINLTNELSRMPSEFTTFDTHR